MVTSSGYAGAGTGNGVGEVQGKSVKRKEDMFVSLFWVKYAVDNKEMHPDPLQQGGRARLQYTRNNLPLPFTAWKIPRPPFGKFYIRPCSGYFNTLMPAWPKSNITTETHTRQTHSK